MPPINQFNSNVWSKLLMLERKFSQLDEPFTYKHIMDAFHVCQSTAIQYNWTLKNREIIQSKPQQERIQEAERVLVLNDIHIPYEDKRAIETALMFGDRFDPTIVLLNGDVLDFYQISRFVKKPANHSPEEELRQVKIFLTNLRERFPKARIIYKQGNHEARLEAYILNNAKEIYNLINDLLARKLGFNELNIEYHENFFQLGKLWILHGHEKPQGGDPEYVTNVIFKYVLDHFIVGHFHRTQEKIYRRINGDCFWGGALGYLAGPMDYAPLNKWNQGVGRIDFQPNGAFKATLKTIQDGELY